MSKYNLTDILNEFIGGGRIGTLKISFKDLQDKMDELEKSDRVIVRTLSGPSGDGKVNREFEVVDRDSAVPGGNKQEKGFTVYDYKFGFDPGSEEHFMEEYPFSVGGNDLQLAMDLIDGVEPFGIREEKEEMKEDKEKNLINALRFHVMMLEKGNIDKDDFVNAIEELAFGSRRGPNTDDDFEREQRMQMSMREEENINEEMAPTGIGISGDQLKDLIKLGAIAGVEVIVRDKDGKNVRKVDYTLTNTSFEKDPDDIDYVNEDLKAHFQSDLNSAGAHFQT